MGIIVNCVLLIHENQSQEKHKIVLKTQARGIKTENTDMPALASYTVEPQISFAFHGSPGVQENVFI